MRDANQHLTWTEIDQLLRSRAGFDHKALQTELESHLANCSECDRTLESYKVVMSRLDEFNRAGQSLSRDDCPRAEIWAELAAGILSTDDTLRYTRHAAACSSCSVQLQDALQILGPSAPPRYALQQDLKTATVIWQKEFARELAGRSQQSHKEETAELVKLVGKPRSALLRPLWAFAAAAVVLLSATTVFFLMLPTPPEKLLARAYAQQRTLDLRLPGASYGPIQVQRDPRQSQLNSPDSLLEAQYQIKRGLERKPDDPDLLRAKAEADLLAWKYQPAIETLGHALRFKPQSANLLVDLATAHFERGASTDDPADYETALQYLSDALRLSPKDPAALFNRAIVYEQLFLYNRAVEDWELLLTIEGDKGWQQEAEQRLRELRSKLQRHSALDTGAHLTPALFKTSLQGEASIAAEEYLAYAEGKIIPNISSSSAGEENRQLALLLARRMSEAHGDRYLNDLLLSANKPLFQKAAQLLGQASENSKDHYEEAYVSAGNSARLFTELGSDAGALAARFKQAFVRQLELRPCTAAASEVVAGARKHGYAWLEVQSLLEQALCSDMEDRRDDAKELAKKAILIAKQHDYHSFYLRGLVILALLESNGGDDAGALAMIREGLEQYWNGNLPPVRAYSFYLLLDDIAEKLGDWNVQYAAAAEALSLTPGIQSEVIAAAEHSRLAEAALRLGQPKQAEEQFAEAGRLISNIPEASGLQWKLQSKIGMAKIHSLQRDQAASAFNELQSISPEVKNLSYHEIEFKYYSTLAELKMAVGESDAAERFFHEAINVVDKHLASLTNWRERAGWMEQHRDAYLLLSELLFRSGRQQEALDLWERSRSASGGSSLQSGQAELHEQDRPQPSASGNGGSTDAAILTYAFASDGVMIWVRSQEALHSVFSPVLPGDFKRTAENFLEECSRPDSDVANLRADAHALYTWLVQPVDRWLPAKGRIVIEPDGIIGTLPLEALATPSGAYLGDQHTLTLAPMFAVNDGSVPFVPVKQDDPALIVSAPTSPSGSLTPPPGAAGEATQIADQFSHATVLAGAKAKLATVRAQMARNNVFHFAGHATLNRTGAAMLLADGNLALAGTTRDRAGLPPSRPGQYGLHNVKLAVFAACGTAKPGERSPASSLVSEFLHAGTSSVVASLWNVDSVTTSDFMSLFYRSVLSGQTVAGALQTASGSLRNSPGKTHPYYWAAFSAFGNS